MDYLEDKVHYEENSNGNDLEIDLPSLSHDQVRCDVYSLFISVHRTKFGSTDKEIHSVLKFLRIDLADVSNDSTCYLPKSFKTIENEFEQDENDIVEYICYSIRPNK